MEKGNYKDSMFRNTECISEGLERGISQGIAKGITQGITQSILELLEELGEVPANVKEMIEKQEDVEKLRVWHKLAAKSSTVKEFEDLI